MGQELAETTRLNEALGAPSARAMEKLSAAINAEEARAPRPAASAHQLHATALVRRRIEKPDHRHRSLLRARAASGHAAAAPPSSVMN